VTTLIATVVPVWRPGDGEWGELAACKDHPDPDIWHADETSSNPWDIAAKEEARRICKTMCLVRAECLAYALRTGQRTGFWGGLSPRELTKLRRELGRR